MLYWIYDIPNFWLVTLFSVAFVGFSWAGTLLIRPYLLFFIKNHAGVNELVGSVLSCYGVFYGLLLGLIAVAAYQNFADTDSTVSNEAAQLGSLYRDISNYPQPERAELQGLLRDYTRIVIEESWPMQQQGIVNPEEGKRLGDFLARLAAFEPRTKGHEILHAEALRAFNQLSSLRRMRVFSVTSGIPPIMWYVVVIGAFLNIVMVWLLDMKVLAHLFLGGILALFIGTVICLIAAMDNPYRGEVSISSDAFQEVYQHLISEEKKPASSSTAPEVR